MVVEALHQNHVIFSVLAVNVVAVVLNEVVNDALVSRISVLITAVCVVLLFVAEQAVTV